MGCLAYAQCQSLQTALASAPLLFHRLSSRRANNVLHTKVSLFLPDFPNLESSHLAKGLLNLLAALCCFTSVSSSSLCKKRVVLVARLWDPDLIWYCLAVHVYGVMFTAHKSCTSESCRSVQICVPGSERSALCLGHLGATTGLEQMNQWSASFALPATQPVLCCDCSMGLQRVDSLSPCCLATRLSSHVWDMH